MELDGVDALHFKLSLIRNISGRSYFKLPEKLEHLKADINVNSKSACFIYVLLSIFHYDYIKKHRQRVSKYSQLDQQINFGDADLNDMNLSKDIHKIET